MRVLALFMRMTGWRGAITYGTAAVSGLSVGVLIWLVQSSMGGGTRSLSWLLAFSALGVSQLFLNFVSRRMNSSVLQSIVLPGLKADFVERFLASPLRVVETVGRARLTGVLTEDIGQIAFSILAWRAAISGVTAILACMAYVAWVSLALFPIVLAALAAGGILFYVLSKTAQRYSAQARAAQERAMVDVRAVVEGIKELELDATARGRFLREALEPHVLETHERMASSGIADAGAGSWASLIVLAAIGALVFSSPPGTPHDVIVGYAVALLYLQTELMKLIANGPTIRNGENAVRGLEKIALEADAALQAEPTALSASWEKLELDGVTHSYRAGDAPADFTLGPLQFALRPKEIVFVVGGNGSGKSTFANLLVGLYESDNGAIRVDGKVIPAKGREAYRQMFTAVMSNCHVFDRLYGLEGEDLDVRANGYIEKLLMTRKVQVAKGAFSTVALSAGQKKRLALVTAYVEDRSICIFDEWAGEQDPEFKEIFYTQLLPELRERGKTAIVITHDDRYFSYADRIVRMESGKIIEDKATLPS